jgi:fructosamine-3-kinase
MGSNRNFSKSRFDPNLFIKTGPASAFDMFVAEAEGLRELAATKVIRVPEVIEVTVADDGARIVLERIEFEKTTTETESLLGEQLAAVHRCTAEDFGWHRDNTIGLTPQANTQAEDWVSFFREQRLEFQVKLAARNGYNGELISLGRKLADTLPDFFDTYDPIPSLLHGDLWGGNWGAVDGQPIIFDPAVYYGDRETDIAMTKLFGGFGPAFYEAYETAWPLADGSEARLKLYQLYHVLNHLNLFGRGYLAQAISLMRSLLLTGGCERGDVRPK